MKLIGIMNGVGIINGMKKNKKEFNSGRKRVPNCITDVSAEHMKKPKRRKEAERNLKRRYLIALYRDFSPERFDDTEDYEKQ
jgi:hypothetical protein